MTSFSDLLNLQEQERIRLIGEAALKAIIGVMLEKDEPEKIARYKAKLAYHYPGVELKSETQISDLPGVVMLKYGPKHE